jgi:hypothetical protein
MKEKRVGNVWQQCKQSTITTFDDLSIFSNTQKKVIALKWRYKTKQNKVTDAFAMTRIPIPLADVQHTYH